ncbi:MAG: NAD-dependent epimerase/dehydratase family protein [Chitinophagales bacterium]|nr:NAD-dependent epimerase/dehydratase family protein [Chitinophagales bacterium]
MTKVLITGGAGFIGSNLSLDLVSRGHEVTILDSLSPQIHTSQPEKNSPLYKTVIGKVNFIKGSVEDKEIFYKAIENNEVIVHYAAETGTGQSMYEINKYNNVNIGGTANMLDILTNREHKVKKIVVASSRSIYGEGKYYSSKYGIVFPTSRVDNELKSGNFEVSYLDDRNLILKPTDEESKIHPSSFYAITKQVQEQMIMTLCPNIGIAPVALRYQNVYGPGQSLTNPYTGILSIFSNLILSDKPVNIFEDGLESRDFVYISDVVAATRLSIESENANGQILNVGSGVNTSVLAIAKLLYHFYNKEENFKITGNYRLGDIRHNYADLSKVFSKIGFEPSVTMEEGIKNFCSWVQMQNIVDNGYEKSIQEMKTKGLLK